VPGGGDYRFAARAAAPLTFVVTSQASSFRVAADGFINSRAAEPAPPISQGARSVALYPPGGPLFVYMNPSGSEIRMLRLQCP